MVCFLVVFNTVNNKLHFPANLGHGISFRIYGAFDGNPRTDDFRDRVELVLGFDVLCSADFSHSQNIMWIY